MSRVLIRSGKDPRIALSPEASLARNGWGAFGANIGNLLFQTSLFRATSVPGTDTVTDSLLPELGRLDQAAIDRINTEFDAYILPLANAFRGSFVPSLTRLTRVIEQLTIPVVLVGVGAQFLPGADISALSDDVNTASKRFVTAVLDHSASIGVRGEITKQYLRQLGFPGDSIDVIGCPSLYLNGPGLRIDKGTEPLTTDSPIAMNITPSKEAMAPLIDEATTDYPNLVYIPQEHTDLAMMMWSEQRDGAADPRMPTRLDHPLYTDNRMRFFVDPMPWIEFLRAQRFSFGSRIHGNIAALLAGTPAVIVTHDSRTLELAQYHGIPYRDISEIDDTTDVVDLFDAADYSDFNAGHDEGFNRYRKFLDRNGVRHIFSGDGSSDGSSDASGDERTEFDNQMAAAAFPGAIDVAAAGDPALREVYSRLAWLRQGGAQDKLRTVGGYRPPFPGDAAAEPDTDKAIAALTKKVDKLSAEITRLKKQRSLPEKIARRASEKLRRRR